MVSADETELGMPCRILTQLMSACVSGYTTMSSRNFRSVDVAFLLHIQTHLFFPIHWLSWPQLRKVPWSFVTFRISKFLLRVDADCLLFFMSISAFDVLSACTHIESLFQIPPFDLSSFDLLAGLPSRSGWPGRPGQARQVGLAGLKSMVRPTGPVRPAWHARQKIRTGKIKRGYLETWSRCCLVFWNLMCLSGWAKYQRSHLQNVCGVRARPPCKIRIFES